MTNQTELSKVFRLCNMQPIAFNPAFKVLTGSVHGGILLSQIMYWYSRVQRKFYKTDKELKEELFFSERELRTAKNHIKNVPFVKISKEGIPCKTYYDINWDLFQVSMKAISDKVTFDDTVQPSSDDTVITGRDDTVKTITYTTTDTTTYNKEDTKVSKKKSYSEEYENLWIAYERKGSKKVGYTYWNKLTLDEKQDALKAVPLYKKEQPEYKYRKDIERYLRDKLFEAIIERSENQQPAAAPNRPLTWQEREALKWGDK